VYGLELDSHILPNSRLH
jgi:hypothetical protein